MLENVEVLYHSSVKIKDEKVIYIDPFKINKSYNDADIIFITHDHYDHYSEEDIDKIIKTNTTIVVPDELLTKLLKKGIKRELILVVEPEKEYLVQGVKFKTIPAYNTNKQFHPKENGWVGYVIESKGIKYYFAGDTDITTEKMAQISPIIAKLEGKRGVLHLEYYENDSNVITFSEEEADEPSEDNTTSEDDTTLEGDTTSEDSSYDSYGTSDSQGTYYGE